MVSATLANRFQYLSDEMIYKIMTFLTEEQLFQSRLVCQRWYQISQDHHLFDSNIEIMKEAKKQLIAGQEQAEEELGKLAEAVVACYENEPGNVGAEIKVRMTRKQKALVEQIQSFNLIETIDEIISAYSLCNNRKEQVQTLKLRRKLYEKLIQQATEEYIYLMVNPDVQDMQKNPFVDISYKTALLPPVLCLLYLLDVDGASIDAAVVEGESRHQQRLGM